MAERLRPPVYSPLQEDQRLPDPPLGGGGGGVAPCEPPSGFPRMTSFDTTEITTNATSHVVNLPDYAVGDYVLLFIGMDGTTTASATGWTSITTAASAGNCSVGVLGRVMDGSEGTTVTVTTSASEQITVWAVAIQDYQGTPEGTSSGIGTAETRLVLPALTPSWGADDDLWFAFTVQDGSATTGIQVESQPLRYIYAYHKANANTATVSIAICYRWLNAASETPPPFRSDASEQYARATVAVRGS